MIVTFKYYDKRTLPCKSEENRTITYNKSLYEI